MVTHVVNKVNFRLRFLYRQNKLLDIPVHRLVGNAMMQPFFDYACNVWYLNLNKNLKARLEAAQNKCIRICLKLGDKKSITAKEFDKINRLPNHESVNQCILSCIYKFHAEKHPIIWTKFFTMQSAMEFLHKKLPHRKTNQGLRAILYIGPSLWNNQDKS